MEEDFKLTITESKTVLCAKCGTEHDRHPVQRKGFDGEGKPISGVFAKDYTYHNDWFLDRGYVPLCNAHSRDELSVNPVPEGHSAS